jgi:transcriptional regulator with XRE-family HTH domain
MLHDTPWFSVNIKIARIVAGLTQAQLASRAGLRQTLVSDLELGKRPRGTQAQKVADALGVEADVLLAAPGARLLTALRHHQQDQRAAHLVATAASDAGGVE